MSHTPGPWRINDRNKKRDFFIAAEGEQNALVVALMLTGFPPDSERSEANARLIAAAPELLEQCRHALAILNGSNGRNGGYVRNTNDGYVYAHEVIDRIEERLSAAIAKATGETP